MQVLPDQEAKFSLNIPHAPGQGIQVRTSEVEVDRSGCGTSSKRADRSDPDPSNSTFFLENWVGAMSPPREAGPPSPKSYQLVLDLDSPDDAIPQASLIAPMQLSHQPQW